MATYYYIADHIVEGDAVSADIDRFYNGDYWMVRVDTTEPFSTAILMDLVPNTVTTVKIQDDNGTLILSGTISYFASTIDHSYVVVTDATITSFEGAT